MSDLGHLEDIAVTYKFTNGRIKACVLGEWSQWGGTTEQLCYAMPLTEALNQAANEVVCDYRLAEAK